MIGSRTFLLLALLAAGALTGARAQQAAPVETAPLPPPAGAPPAGAPAPPAQTNPLPTTTPPSPAQPNAAAPGGQPTPPQAAVAPPVPPARGPLPTLVEKPGDPSDVDDVTLAAKPAITVSGESSWEEGVKNLKGAFQRLNAELGKAGMAPAGRPIAVFTRTDDDGFRFDAMIPVASAPPARPPGMAAEIRFAATPAGRALRFVHKGAYDDIDTTYETVTAYLDAKGVLVQDSFMEEYATDLNDGADTGLEVNIFALPR